ncbi:hypothetical protein ACXYMX_00300 [Sporosarcina sp. CAU 1771]
MDFLAVGVSSKTIYASGTRADCMRRLIEKYPTTKEGRGVHKKSSVAVKIVLPEPVILIRK